jgi:hypothetical protein
VQKRRARTAKADPVATARGGRLEKSRPEGRDE